MFKVTKQYPRGPGTKSWQTVNSVYVYALELDLRFLEKGMFVVKQTLKELLTPALAYTQSIDKALQAEDRFPQPQVQTITCPQESLQAVTDFVEMLYNLQEQKRDFEHTHKGMLDLFGEVYQGTIVQLKSVVGQQTL